jgi:very-short-patch-repair endonuclease
VTPDQVRLRLERGRLHELHRGVYLAGHEVPPPHALEMAALLACGPRAVLSHRTAAALWGLLPHLPAAHVCVTVPPRRTIERPRITIHRSHLERRDICRRYGLALTSPPRTILDLAAELGREVLERVVAEANYRRLARESELPDQLERNPDKRGAASLRRILDLAGGPRRTRSPAELRMLRLLRHAGITGYETNARIHGFEVHLLWRELSFAVEIDGYAAHSGRIAFERGRLKLATLEAKGVRVMPVTPRQIGEDPEGVLARLLDGLALAGHPPAAV